jgi:hypothetical protein
MIWFALLLGGLPLGIYYIIEHFLGLHYHRDYPVLFFCINMVYTLIVVFFYVKYTKKWISGLKDDK